MKTLETSVLRSGAELGNSEHSFGLRLIAVQPFIFGETKRGLIFSPIRATGSENGPGLHFAPKGHRERIPDLGLHLSAAGLAPVWALLFSSFAVLSRP